MGQDSQVVYVFHCKSCGWPMSLRAETLGHMFGTPGRISGAAHSVGVACLRCKHVRNYSLLRNSPDYNPLDGVEWARPFGDTVSLEPLRCEVEGCKAQLPLFAMWSKTTTAEERRADMSTWQWDGLHCPQGHKIEAPQA